MWAEAILLEEDLTKLVGQFLPVTLGLDNGASFSLTDPSDVSLVADVGLRAACKAKIHWPLLGIDVPVTVRSLTVLLRPEIETRSERQALVFKLEIEHIDLAGLPAFLDDRLTERANAELAAKHVELTWDFVRTLTHAFPLPTSLESLDAIELGVRDARVKVTDNAMGLAIQFDFTVTREGDGSAERRALESSRRPSVSREPGPMVRRTASRKQRAIVAGGIALLALLAAGGFFAFFVKATR